MTKATTVLDETALTHAIVKHLGALPGVWLHRNNTGVARHGRLRFGLGKGGADIVGVVRGRAVAIEVKDPNAPPNRKKDADQLAWRADWEAAGGFYCVVETMAEAENAVDGLRAVRTVAA